MKTNELIKRVMEINGVNDYHQGEEILCFYASKPGGIVAHANKIKKFEISTDCGDFSKLCSSSQELLLDLLYQYATTPIEKREEPKRYKLKHRWVKGCINYYSKGDELFFAGPNETNAYKTAFSIEEWEKITNRKWERLLDEFEEELEVG